jgi:hypothetical protein
MKVADFMSTQVVTISPARTNVQRAEALMASLQIESIMHRSRRG